MERILQTKSPLVEKWIADGKSLVVPQKIGEESSLSVTPIEMWLAAVRNMKPPKQLRLERHDEILSIDVVRELPVLKLKLQIRRAISLICCCV